MATVQTKSSTPRRFWLGLILLGLGVGFVAAEGAALGWFAFKQRAFYYTTEFPPPSLAPDDDRSPLTTAQLHPYFGFAMRPGIAAQGAAIEGVAALPADAPGQALLTSNNFGFPARVDYPFGSEQDFIVGIFGGSAAGALAVSEGGRIGASLSQHPAVAGRRVRVLNFARGGYKQPQQLLLLNYFLFIGQRFDVIVNVDGFNEVVLGTLNQGQGVDASMPAVRMLTSFESVLSGDRAFSLGLARVALAREELARVRARRRASRLALLYWARGVESRRAAEHYAASRKGVRTEIDPNASWLAFLPPLPGSGEDRLVDLWERGSRTMAQLAELRGIPYLHVLQPNQYYRSSRRFTDEERAIAFNPASSYWEPAKKLYPKLRARGLEMSESGFPFFDAALLFDKVPVSVYADDCCHYNALGNELLAEFVRERIANALDTPLSR